MVIASEDAGIVRIVGPEEGDFFWQPIPANGFVRNIFNDRTVAATAAFSFGTQTVAPHALIREHTHAHHEEIIYVVDGRGVARVDGIEHPLEKGSAVFIGRNRRHHFLNPHAEPLTFVVLMMPGGLDAFFAEIGRRRAPGEPPPAPFPRPDNIAEIEARTVFGWVDASYDRSK